jgi:predicted TIM-barrel fold metal-dependent hydrolase
MIIDAHAHISETTYGNVELYRAQLQESGIERGVVVPGGMLDVRKMTDYVIGRAKPDSLVPNNTYVKRCCRKFSSQLQGLVCLNPHDATAPAQLETAFKQGFRGLKLSPMTHEFSFGSKVIADLADCCAQYDYPFYTHVVYSPGASTARLVTLAKQFPKTWFIMGHMGFGPADCEGVAAAATLDNFFLETSTCNFLHLQAALPQVGSTKLIFGSEFPLSHPAVELHKVLLLKITDQEQDNILGENIRALLRFATRGEKRNGSKKQLAKSQSLAAALSKCTLLPGTPAPTPT